MWNRYGGYREREWGPGPGRGGYGGDYDRALREGSEPWPRPSHARPRGQGYGRDYWWLGEHELRRRGRLGGYDAAYERFDERHHPRFSPVGGMYPPVGGGYYARHQPRPLRENMWFSDWTRWF